MPIISYFPSGGGNSAGATAGVESFKGRTGAVVPKEGDYTAEQVGAVPVARRINYKPLSSDIALSAEDVDAVSIDRTINGHSLTDDVELTAADIGAITTDQLNAAIQSAILDSWEAAY